MPTFEFTARPSPFKGLPHHPRIQLAWPTPNHHLFDRPAAFFARTGANPNYGRPGWTRDCGQRVHGGCDIASINFTPTGQTVAVLFTDCRTGNEYPSREPTFIPNDPVFCVFEGRVEDAVADAETSDFGIHVMIQHRWPKTGSRFFTLYAHLAYLAVQPGSLVERGQPLGAMGTTSRIADARNWMAIAPHLHFEVWDENQDRLDPEAFLTAHLTNP